MANTESLCISITRFFDVGLKLGCAALPVAISPDNMPRMHDVSLWRSLATRICLLVASPCKASIQELEGNCMLESVFIDKLDPFGIW